MRTEGFSLVGALGGQMFQAPVFLHSGYKWHSWWFKKEDMKASVKDKVVVITGANSGLGFSAAETLAKREAIVHMICRSQERGQKAVDSVKASSGNQNVFLHVCDVSVMSQVRDFVNNFTKSNDIVDVLINNAGALANERVVTSEGNEQTLACHLLGPFLLTRLLAPALMKSADPRVINVSSAGMYAAKMDVDDLQMEKYKFNGTNAYAKMKRAQIYVTDMLAKQYNGKIKVNCMHPGWAQSGGLGPLFDQYPMYKKLLPLFRKTEEGADTIVWMSVVPYERLANGKFYFDRRPVFKHVVGSSTYSTAKELETLWSECEKLTGLESTPCPGV